MTLEKPTIVLFDMDGTTVRHVNPVFLGALEMVDNMLNKVGSIIHKRNEITDFSHTPAAPRGLLVHRMLHKFRRKPVDKIVQPCPGIYLLLNLFRENGIPIGIVSNSLGKGYGHDVLKTFALSQYYEAEIFREDITHSKPHPDPILRALREMKVQPNADDIVWYFGDRGKDVIATVAADELSDFTILPFAYGLNSSVEILKRNISTDHIVMSYPDFYQRIKGMFKDQIQKATPANTPETEQAPSQPRKNYLVMDKKEKKDLAAQ
jgi:phosphoglycolate phosphatase